MELYERVSGARMHAAYVRPGGVAQVNYQTGMCMSNKCDAIRPKDSWFAKFVGPQ